MKKRVILLNRPSGSGKSTLAKTIRAMIADRRKERYAIVSIDDYMRISTEETIYEDDVFEISGDMCRGAIDALDTLPGVIVDHVITSERIYRQFADAMQAYALYTVRLDCPLEELLRRETARKDRCPGTAEASFTYLYPKDGYDLAVDTHRMTAEECAEAICAALFENGTKEDGHGTETDQTDEGV